MSIKACEPLHRHYCNITTLLGQLQQSFQFFPPNMAVAQNLPLKSLSCKPGCGVFFGYFDVLLERKYRSVAVIDSLTCARLCLFVVPSGLPLYQPMMLENLWGTRRIPCTICTILQFEGGCIYHRNFGCYRYGSCETYYGTSKYNCLANNFECVLKYGHLVTPKAMV